MPVTYVWWLKACFKFVACPRLCLNIRHLLKKAFKCMYVCGWCIRVYLVSLSHSHGIFSCFPTKPFTEFFPLRTEKKLSVYTFHLVLAGTCIFGCLSFCRGDSHGTPSYQLLCYAPYSHVTLSFWNLPICMHSWTYLVFFHCLLYINLFITTWSLTGKYEMVLK